ncbi:hypothetical protein GGR90_001543 [Sphingopyxis italica]|uniref:NACHT domain-containing protein n=1 Tax=Sphingopyxis italica TaxID=1129133 RepID=A0A7X5XR43_9SPHN|nr:NACHT domain-containing protein [Sphingopyxis italica]NJB89368.1 hypothetical protein [Sphingopyxis italica]
MNISNDAAFEEEVRKIAKQLFPGVNPNDSRYADGRERDGLFDDGECVHIFEATVSKKTDKVKNDIRKSSELVGKIRREKPTHNVKIWIVTAEPPTADQIEEGVKGRARARCPIEVCGFESLYNRLFDAREFLRLRSNYPFGSIRNPDNDNDKNVPLSEYIEVRFCDRAGNSEISVSDICKKIQSPGYRGAIIGDYGAGKSMALRHIYYKMYSLFENHKTTQFPIYLNLRDHFGQTDPSEALIRHATKLGHPSPHRLVSAWRAGYSTLILDGFDELSPTQLSSTTRNLRDARLAASILLSNFLSESPVQTSIVCAGRLHYFDDEKEMRRAIVT